MTIGDFVVVHTRVAFVQFLSLFSLDIDAIIGSTSTKISLISWHFDFHQSWVGGNSAPHDMVDDELCTGNAGWEEDSVSAVPLKSS